MAHNNEDAAGVLVVMRNTTVCQAQRRHGAGSTVRVVSQGGFRVVAWQSV